MDTMHPLMQSALAPFMPHNTLALLSGQSPKPGPQASAWREHDLMRRLELESKSCEVLRKQLLAFDAPSCPADRVLHTMDLPGLGRLECWLIYEEAEPEHGAPAVMELEYAYLHGVDIADRLLKGEVKTIECAAAKAMDKAQAL